MESFVAKRADVAVLELVGPDTRRFANGMFTNNVRDLPVGEHQHSALCDDRGRLQALMDVVMLAEDRLLLVLEGLTADAFEERYGMFIVFDDVELQRRAGEVYTVQGPDADPAWAEGALTWPSLRTLDGGFDVWLDGPLPASLAALPSVDDETLEALRIERGWPRFPVDASDKQLPHELGLRATHLHFEKGCYRGQEIIHRVDVMGQVRKGLVGVSLSAPIDVGATLTRDGKKVGRMGSSAVHPKLGRIGLAVVRNAHHEVGTPLESGDAVATVRALS